MSKSKTKGSIRVEGSAKAEAIAKATFERKKTITEIVPPDVIRAKAGRWLDLISPITEWAGLKGDALRNRRAMLRVQQEAALEVLAASIKEKMGQRQVVEPIPAKILVPALEFSSLEDPNSPLIDWWANLLVSGATGMSLRPYLVDLMKSIGPEEAEFLHIIWSKFSAVEIYLSYDTDIPLNIMFSLNNLQKDLLEKYRGPLHKGKNKHEFFEYIAGEFVEVMEKKGIQLNVEIPVEDGWLVHRAPLYDRHIPAQVCNALNLTTEYTGVLNMEYSKFDIPMI